jgi:hypothetical protein
MTEPSLELRDSATQGGAANGTNGGVHSLPMLEAAGIVPGADAAPIIVPPGESPALKQKDQVEQSVSASPAANDCAAVKVADVRKNRTDCRGEKIEFVFFRRKDYVIYRSGSKIFVHYADDEKKASEQVANTAELLPLRGRLQYLVKDMEAPQAYHWQIAEAFRLGLDGQKDAAKNILEDAISNILAKRVSKGRMAYIFYAGLAALLVVVAAGAAAIWCPVFAAVAQGTDTSLTPLLLATASGAMGALLSTAIALRARTVATEGDFSSNVVDSAVRILIGVISAAALYLLLDSNLLKGLSLTPEALGPGRIWQIALLAGFVAGFLERLVPDLLENKVAPALAK